MQLEINILLQEMAIHAVFAFSGGVMRGKY